MTVRLALAAAALPSRGPAGSHCPCARGSPCPPLQGFLSPWSECWHDVTFLFPHPWSLLPVLTVSCAKSRPCVPCRGCSGFGLPGGGGRDGRALFYGTGQLYIIKVMVFPVVMYRCESWIIKYWCFRTVLLEKTVESPLDCKEIKPVHPKGNQPRIFIGRTCCWSWSSNTLATWCKEPTHRKRPWCWERLRAGGEGGDRGWDSWMASVTQWT